MGPSARCSFAPGARANALQQRIAQGHDAANFRIRAALHDEHTPTRRIVSQRFECRECTLRPVDDDRFGAVGEHGLNGTFHLESGP